MSHAGLIIEVGFEHLQDVLVVPFQSGNFACPRVAPDFRQRFLANKVMIPADGMPPTCFEWIEAIGRATFIRQAAPESDRTDISAVYSADLFTQIGLERWIAPV